ELLAPRVALGTDCDVHLLGDRVEVAVDLVSLTRPAAADVLAPRAVAGLAVDRQIGPRELEAARAHAHTPLAHVAAGAAELDGVRAPPVVLAPRIGGPALVTGGRDPAPCHGDPDERQELVVPGQVDLMLAPRSEHEGDVCHLAARLDPHPPERAVMKGDDRPARDGHRLSVEGAAHHARP